MLKLFLALGILFFLAFRFTVAGESMIMFFSVLTWDWNFFFLIFGDFGVLGLDFVFEVDLVFFLVFEVEGFFLGFLDGVLFFRNFDLVSFFFFLVDVGFFL